MAVGVLMTMPGTTRKQYEKINERIFGHHPMERADAPDGLILHSAGPTADGWWVFDLWESRDAFERFGRERVAPAVREVTSLDFAAQQPAFYEVASMVSAGLTPVAA